MNLNISLTDLEQGKLTDFQLIIFDENNRFKLNLHKCVLYFKCPYFRSAIDFNPKLEFLEIPADNADIMRSIILSLYGISEIIEYPEWYWNIEEMKYCKYLGIDFNIKNLYKLNVPEDNFDNLFYILDYYDPLKDDELMKTFMDNLSFDKRKNFTNLYDITKFPEKFLEKLLKEPIQIVNTREMYYVKIWNISCNRHTKTINTNKAAVRNYSFSKNKEEIIIVTDRDIQVHHIYKDECRLLNFDKYENVSFATISKDNNYIVGKKNGSIILLDINKSEVKTILNDEKFSQLSPITLDFSNNSKYIAIGYNNGLVAIFDIENFEIIKKWKTSEEVVKLIFSNDDKYIYASSQHNIKIWDIDNISQGAEILYQAYGTIINIVLSNDNNYLIIRHKYDTYIFNINTKKIDHTHCHYCAYNDHMYFSDANEIIIIISPYEINLWNFALKKSEKFKKIIMI